jgi:hypothetical protein
MPEDWRPCVITHWIRMPERPPDVPTDLQAVAVSTSTIQLTFFPMRWGTQAGVPGASYWRLGPVASLHARVWRVFWGIALLWVFVLDRLAPLPPES